MRCERAISMLRLLKNLAEFLLFESFYYTNFCLVAQVERSEVMISDGREIADVASDILGFYVSIQAMKIKDLFVMFFEFLYVNCAIWIQSLWNFN